MRLLTLLLFTISFGAFGFTPLPDWNACEEKRCVNITSGDDLYLKHKFKVNKATYQTTFNLESIQSCIKENDCWLYLGSVGDTATVKLNNVIIGKFDQYIHFDSLKFHIPTNLISERNELLVEVTDLNQTRFGLRSTDIGIGQYFEVDIKSNIDWVLRTGSPLLSAFTLFVLLLGLIATYTIYRNPKIIPIIALSFISVLYLLSFSELSRQYIDPIYASGPLHFVLRLTLDLTLVLVALSLYRPHQKISYLSKLPFLYIIPISIMIGAAILEIHQYAFYKTTMLIFAPLVIGGGLTLAILSHYYYEQKERQIVLPLFVGLLAFQIYDLIVFWEIIQGSFTVKWYLPFLVISFSWIYVRRRIFEVRTLKIDAIVGDEVRKLAHDLAAPIKNLTSLSGTIEHDLILRNVKDLEDITKQVLGRYNHSTSKFEIKTQNNLYTILTDIQEKFKDKINIIFKLSMEFDWYYVDATLFTRTFTNLITNSIKAEATKIEITGYLKNNFLNIDVLDNGKGIPKKLQPYIFQKGITSDRSTGNGLGLSFVKEKFTELGFDILLASSTKGSTSFCIKLPLNEIVLIDDNELVRDTWKTLALSVGIPFKDFSNSNEFSKSDIKHTSHIFVDYNLQIENGVDVINKLRKLGFQNVVLSTAQENLIHENIVQTGKAFPL
jgi:signal transduction histidine kinase